MALPNHGSDDSKSSGRSGASDRDVFVIKEYGTLNYDALSCLVEKDSVVLEVAVGSCLLWGAVGKSAQLGLHT